MPAVDVVLAVDGGHGHVLSFGPGIGPLLLRVLLLVAVLVVASFAFLRGFLGEPGRLTTLGVLGAASAGVAMELLLSGGFDLPEQVVPLLLAALALPYYLYLSTDPRFAPVVGRVRGLAPAVFVLAGAAALFEFARAWVVRATPDAASTSLHTGLVFALIAIAWYAIVPARRLRGAGFGVSAAAAALAVALLACAANTVVLGTQEPVQKAATPAGTGTTAENPAPVTSGAPAPGR